MENQPGPSVSTVQVDLDIEEAKQVIEDYCTKWLDIHQGVITKPEEHMLDVYDSFLAQMHDFVLGAYIGYKNRRDNPSLRTRFEDIYLLISPDIKIYISNIGDYLNALAELLQERRACEKEKAKSIRATEMFARTLAVFSQFYMIRNSDELDQPIVPDASPFGIFINALHEYMLFCTISLQEKRFSTRQRNIEFREAVETLFEAFKESKQVVNWRLVLLKNCFLTPRSKMWETLVIKLEINKWIERISAHLEQLPTKDESPKTDDSDSIPFHANLVQFHAGMSQLIDNMDYLANEIEKLKSRLEESKVAAHQEAAGHLAMIEKKYAFLLHFMTYTNYVPELTNLAVAVFKPEPINFKGIIPVLVEIGIALREFREQHGNIIQPNQMEIIYLFTDYDLPQTEQEVAEMPDFIENLTRHFETAFQRNLQYFYQLVLQFEQLAANKDYYDLSQCRRIFQFHAKIRELYEKMIQSKKLLESGRNLKNFVQSWSTKFKWTLEKRVGSAKAMEVANYLNDLMAGIYPTIYYGDVEPLITLTSRPR